MKKAENTSFHGDFHINREWCKGCGICMAFCPRKALFLDEHGKAERDVEECSACGICATFCPDFAIAVDKRRVSVDAGNKTGFNAGQ